MQYALQTGLKLRVMMEIDLVSLEAAKLSFQILQKTQTNMASPRQVEVTVVTKFER